MSVRVCIISFTSGGWECRVRVPQLKRALTALFQEEGRKGRRVHTDSLLL